MTSVIDFHTHFFSRTFFEALARMSPLPGTPEERLQRAAKAARIEVPEPGADAQLARWTSEMERHGVQHLVSFASVPEEAEVVAEAAARSRGRITPLAQVDPRAEGAAARTRELLAGQGFRGVVLFPALHRFRIDGPEAARVLEVLVEHQGIAVVHC